jgi:hypothetical protein
MYHTAINLLDDLNEYDDLVEVDFRVDVKDVRTITGLYAGLERAERGAWYLLLHGKATIRTIDVVDIKRARVETTGQP